MDDTIVNLVTAIKTGRNDIVRSAISILEKSKKTTGNSSELDRLLNSHLTADGTLLHLAVKSSNMDVARILLAAGADPGVLNEQGESALDLATSEQMHSVFDKELLQAVSNKNIARIIQLLSAGVSVNLDDSPDSRNSPLHWAATYATREVVQCLCVRGANVNYSNIHGVTALHEAVVRGDKDIVEELLKFGALSSIRATSGAYTDKSAADLAVSKPDILALLNTYSLAKMATSELNNNDAIDGFPVTARKQSNSTSTLPVDALTEKVASSGEDAKYRLLWPKPKQLVPLNGEAFRCADVLHIVLCAPKDDVFHLTDVWRFHWEVFRSLSLTLSFEPSPDGRSSESHPHVVCEVHRRLFPRAESYSITVAKDKISIQAADFRGVHYAIYTLVQLFDMFHENGVPALQIIDYPDLADRGVMLDLSKGRVPKFDNLRETIMAFSFLKYNQLYFYYQFQLLDNPETKWRFPYSKTHLLDISKFCQDLGIDLLPVVDVTSKIAFENLHDLYAQFEEFIRAFPSANIVGIGPRLSGLFTEVAESGVVSIDDVRSFVPIDYQQTVQMCAFPIHDRLESSAVSVAKKPVNLIMAEYGFKADCDFRQSCKQLATMGLPVHLVCGTSAWNCVGGCPEAAVKNIHTAATQALSHNALGLIVSHWAGIGSVTHQHFAWPAYLCAAGLAWNAGISLDHIYSNLSDLLNQHLLHDPASAIGGTMVDMGRVEMFLLRAAYNINATDYTNLPPEKGSILFQLLVAPDKLNLEHLTPDVFQKASRLVRKCQVDMEAADTRNPLVSVLVAELSLAADLMLTACRLGKALAVSGKNPSTGSAGLSVVNVGVHNVPLTTRTDLANRLLASIDAYHIVWHASHMPHGIQESAALLSTALHQLIPSSDSSKLTNGKA